jgi:hypothetical protein
MQPFEGKYVMSGRGLKLHFDYAMQLLTSGSHASVAAVSGFSGFGGQTNNQAAQAISQGSFFPGGINQGQAGRKIGSMNQEKPRGLSLTRVLCSTRLCMRVLLYFQLS